MDFDEKDMLACCDSTKFAREMVLASPFASLGLAVSAARDIWFNNVDVSGWLEAFAAHPQIGESPSSNTTNAGWSKGEQSTAVATATDSSLQELAEWNGRYRQKFGHIFIIFASGRSAGEILAELKKRYSNRPIVGFEMAATEQIKITEIRLAKLFSTKAEAATKGDSYPTVDTKKAEAPIQSFASCVANISTNPAFYISLLHLTFLKSRRSSKHIIGAHITAASEALAGKPPQVPSQTRPPITTHVLDVAWGHPAAGIEVNLEMWNGNQARPQFGKADTSGWILQGFSTTDKDGRSGQLNENGRCSDPRNIQDKF